jgi:hypothetical protein
MAQRARPVMTRQMASMLPGRPIIYAQRQNSFHMCHQSQAPQYMATFNGRMA